MKRVASIVVAVAVLVVGTALAGDKEHVKCTAPPEECLKKLQQKIDQKAWLGIEMEATEDGRWRITRVVPDSPAERAGFADGDVLLAMNGHDYSAQAKDQVSKAWSEVKPGSSASYVVFRDGAKVSLDATLGHVPDEMAKKWIAEHMAKAHGGVKLAQKTD